MQTLQRLLLFCSSFLFYCSIIIKNSFWVFFLPIGPQKPTTLLKVLRETHWGWNSQWWEQYTGKCQLLLKFLSCDSLQGSKRAAVVQAWQLCLLLWNLNSESQTKAILISCTMRETKYSRVIKFSHRSSQLCKKPKYILAAFIGSKRVCSCQVQLNKHTSFRYVLTQYHNVVGMDIPTNSPQGQTALLRETGRK